MRSSRHRFSDPVRARPSGRSGATGAGAGSPHHCSVSIGRHKQGRRRACSPGCGATGCIHNPNRCQMRRASAYPPPLSFRRSCSSACLIRRMQSGQSILSCSKVRLPCFAPQNAFPSRSARCSMFRPQRCGEELVLCGLALLLRWSERARSSMSLARPGIARNGSGHRLSFASQTQTFPPRLYVVRRA